MENVLIKNMVCRRCIRAVKAILNKTSIPFHQVVLGEIHLHQELTENQRSVLKSELEMIGFELIDNHTTEVIEKAKQIIIKKPVMKTKLKIQPLSFLPYYRTG